MAMQRACAAYRRGWERSDGGKLYTCTEGVVSLEMRNSNVNVNEFSFFCETNLNAQRRRHAMTVARSYIFTLVH